MIDPEKLEFALLEADRQKPLSDLCNQTINEMMARTTIDQKETAMLVYLNNVLGCYFFPVTAETDPTIRIQMIQMLLSDIERVAKNSAITALQFSE